jgi:4-alpha-glucanotransferase
LIWDRHASYDHLFSLIRIQDKMLNMKVSFYIHYATHWGQQLIVTGESPELGKWETGAAPHMNYKGNGWWELKLELKTRKTSIAYKYVLLNEGSAEPAFEWGENRKLLLRREADSMQVIDSWRTHNAKENAFHSAAFEGLIFHPSVYQGPKKRSGTEQGRVVRFQIDCPYVKEGHRICLLGSGPALGDWDYNEAILFYRERNSSIWYFDLPLEKNQDLEYKYGLFDENTETVIGLETGPNRSLAMSRLDDDAGYVIRTDEYFQDPQGSWKGAGLAIPVFSIRTKNGLGVGEFADLPMMIDWALKAGLKMVQILPVNDTSATGSWKDSYPYSGISVFALHPMYLNIEKIGKLNKKDRELYESEKLRLNALKDVDYKAVMDLKLALARKLYEKGDEKFLSSSSFQAFFEENKSWLRPYAAFCYFRDKKGTADFGKWGKSATCSDELLDKLNKPGSASSREIGFHYFLQYHLDKQLRAAADYARKMGVVLKGDIPIGIFRQSADAWVAPELYNMSGQAGAPPDDFAVTGQNWGFPTYNWERMAEDGYAWWQKRFQQLSRYFDAFRIDHILGFFRIWEIPYEQVDGVMGRFNKALPIHVNEFKTRGIEFEYDRFCRPYITGSLVWDSFGDHTDFVIDTFLDVIGESRFQLKPAFSTQRKIEAYFEKNEHPDKEDMQRKLFDLVSNVLFFEVEGSEGTLLHPRISLHDTFSYQTLSSVQRQKVNELYTDYYYTRQEDFWREQGMIKLPAIKSATNMLVCGEDLGMVPECVPDVMNELGILSLEIQRMSKNPKTDFLASEDIPYLSVCSPSTHDMAPLRAWWEEEDPDRINRMYYDVLGMTGERPFYCETYIVEAIIHQHLHFPSMWVVFPIQDLLGMNAELRREKPAEERINDPSNSKHYWRYRMHIELEDLLQEDTFNDHLKGMVEASGR